MFTQRSNNFISQLEQFSSQGFASQHPTVQRFIQSEIQHLAGQPNARSQFQSTFERIPPQYASAAHTMFNNHHSGWNPGFSNPYQPFPDRPMGGMNMGDMGGMNMGGMGGMNMGGMNMGGMNMGDMGGMNMGGGFGPSMGGGTTTVVRDAMGDVRIMQTDAFGDKKIIEQDAFGNRTIIEQDAFGDTQAFTQNNNSW